MFKIGNAFYNFNTIKKIEYIVYESSPYGIRLEFNDGTYDELKKTHIDKCPKCQGGKIDASMGGDGSCEDCDDTGYVNVNGNLADSDFDKLVRYINDKVEFKIIRKG